MATRPFSVTLPSNPFSGLLTYRPPREVLRVGAVARLRDDVGALAELREELREGAGDRTLVWRDGGVLMERVGALCLGATERVGALRRGATDLVGALCLGATDLVGALCLDVLCREVDVRVGALCLGAAVRVGALWRGATERLGVLVRNVVRVGWVTRGV